MKVVQEMFIQEGLIKCREETIPTENHNRITTVTQEVITKNMDRESESVQQ
jgi:hypothetical protein